MERFRDYLGVSPEKFTAYLIRQATCTQAKLVEACKGISLVALRSEKIDTPGAALGEAATEGDLDREALVKMGVLEPLLRLLSAKAAHGPEVRAEALRCLNIMCKTASIKLKVVQMDLMVHIKPMLVPEATLEMLELILKLIGTLTVQEDNQVILQKKGFVPVVMAFSTHESKDIKYYVARALANLALNPTNQMLMGELKGIAALLALSQAQTKEEEIDGVVFEPSPLVEIQEEAVRALWNMCGTSDNQATMCELGGVEVMCELLKTTTEVPVKRQVAGCMGNLALHEGARAVLIEGQASEMLMELCYEEDVGCQRNATSALSNMALDEQTRGEMMMMGCVETMVMMCKDEAGDPMTRRGAAGVLWNVALSEENRAQILEEGGLEVLLELAHPRNYEITEAQGAAAGCLGLLCLQEEVRDRILKMDKLQQIIHLTKSADEKVQQAAAEVIECFLMEQYLETLEDQGAIEALQFYACSVVRRRRVAGREKKRRPRDFESPPEPHPDKGVYSFPTPPPQYRPVTPAPLYEIDAMEWWPNTQVAPLCRPDTATPAADPYAAPGGPTPGEEESRPALEGPESMLFFQGQRLATPVHRADTPPILGGTSPNRPDTGLQGTSSSAPFRKLDTPNTPGSVFSGRAQSRSNASQRFYF